MGRTAPQRIPVYKRVRHNKRTMEPSLFKVHSLKRMTQPGAKFCLPVYLCPWYSPRWVLLSRWMSKAGSHKCDGGPSAMSQESDHSTIPRSKCNVFSLLLRCADVITSYYIICCRARLNFSAASVLLQCCFSALRPRYSLFSLFDDVLLLGKGGAQIGAVPRGVPRAVPFLMLSRIATLL